MENYSADPKLQARFTPILEALEADRYVIARRNYNNLAIAAGLVIGFGIISFDLQNPNFVIGAAIVSLIGFVAFSNKGADVWAARYKQEVVHAIVKSFFGEQGSYNPEQGHSETEFEKTELFDNAPDRYSMEDLITGKVDKTLIRFSEVHAEYKTTDSKGRTSWHTIFKGILFTADFNKHFNGRTIVKQSGFWNFFSYGNIELENLAFRKEFSVFADDPVEVRYILSPSLMERILDLNKNWGGQLAFSFIGSQLTIAIPMSRNSFEISVWSKIDIRQKWQSDWQIIADMVSIVHDLDLNTRIWTKE